MPPAHPWRTGGVKREVPEAEESEYSSEEEESEQRPDREVHPLEKGGRDKPPEPEGPPPGKHQGEGKKERQDYRGAESSRASWTAKERKRKKSPRRKRKRAGRKHQRLHRVKEDPFTKVHRKIPPSFFDLLPDGEGVRRLQEL